MLSTGDEKNGGKRETFQTDSVRHQWTQLKGNPKRRTSGRRKMIAESWRETEGGERWEASKYVDRSK